MIPGGSVAKAFLASTTGRSIGLAGDDVFSFQRHQDSVPGWTRCRRATSATFAPSSTSRTNCCQNSRP
jgi:hypothetical protein